MFWRVQTVWSGGIHPTFMGREEHLARRDVERIFRTWIIKNLLRVSSIYMQQGGRRAAFALQAKLLADSLARMVEAGDIWGAYDAFHDFQEQFAGEFDFPIWLVAGTVIVEAPAGKGPRTRKSFLTEEDFPEELPPSVMVVDMEGSRPSMGAELRRWKVWWSDFGGRRHASYHMREDDAMAHLATLLRMHMDKLHQHASSEAIFAREPERKEYAEAGIQLVFQVRQLIEIGRTWEAYELWRQFETEFADTFPIPLELTIGTVRAEVE